MHILLFEDTDDRAAELLAAIKSELGEADKVTHFEATKEGTGILENRLLTELADLGDEIDLVVADWELSKTKYFLGLSEPTVRRVAASLAIPECSYTRNIKERELLLSEDQREECITVSIEKGPEDCARQIVSIAAGFMEIRNKFENDFDELATKANPGEVMATILNKPEYAEKMLLYASGDRQRLHTVLKMREAGGADRQKKASRMFGYWLWDSILRYPGLLVNEIAASSYLNIEEKVFQQEEVQACFAAAKYGGPFAESRGKLWWRGLLDDIISDSDFDDGRSLVADTLQKEIPRSECTEDSEIEAGYYCMLSNKPVSFKNSVGGLAWFPRGADLARISNSQDEELGPWLS